MIHFFSQLYSTNQPSVDYFFLVGGQSNTGTNTSPVAEQSPTGRVPYSNLPIELRSVQNKSLVWNGVDFSPYIHPNGDEYGWLNHFLYELNQLGHTVGFYKYGQGGNQLKEGNSPYTSYPRSTLKINGLNAWNAWRATKPNPQLIILWCQGYTDGLDETNSLDYGAHEPANPDHETGGVLGGWFLELRSHFNDPNVKIFYNTLSNNATGSTFRANVKLGQEYVATLSPNNIVINADDLQFLDAAHFGAQGVVDLANLYLSFVLA